MLGLSLGQMVLYGAAGFVLLTMVPWGKLKARIPSFGKPASELDMSLRELSCCVLSPEEFEHFRALVEVATRHIQGDH